MSNPDATSPDNQQHDNTVLTQRSQRSHNGDTPSARASSKVTCDEVERKQKISGEFTALTLILFVYIIVYGSRSAAKLLIGDLMNAQPDVDESYRVLLLSSFYWGYAPPMIFGGWLAQRFGGKIAITVCLTGITLSFLGTCGLLHNAPTAGMSTEQILTAVAGLRFVDGVCQCLFMPATYVFFSERTAKDRLSKYKAVMSLGARSTRFAAAAAVPWLTNSVFEKDVSPMFGVVGALSTVVLFLWLVLLPAKGAAEVDNSKASTDSKTNSKSTTIPLFGSQFWKLVLCGPSLAIAAAHFSCNYIGALLETYSLRYYTEVANVSVTEATLYNSGPLTVGFVSPFACVTMEVFLSSTLHLSTLGVRRTHTCLSLLLAAAAMFLISTGTSANLFFWCALASLFSNGLQTAGYAANYGDVGGRYVLGLPFRCGYFLFMLLILQLH